ncbi:MAG: thioredoxin [Lachnospiraceae bacterium]
MAEIFNDANFEEKVLKSEKPVLVDFYADWCGPCKMMGPLVEEIAKEYGDSVVVGKLNIDDNMATAQDYKVMTIPTLMVFKNGVPAETSIGVVPKAKLVEMVTK